MLVEKPPINDNDTLNSPCTLFDVIKCPYRYKKNTKVSHTEEEKRALEAIKHWNE